MDSITYPTSHDRALKSATRNTGAVVTTRSFAEGVTTFSCKNRAGKVCVSGKIDGETAEVTFATSPAAARTDRAAKRAQKAAAAE